MKKTLPPDADRSLPALFHDSAVRFGNRPALLFKDPRKGRNAHWTWTEWASQVRRTALGLYGLGVRHGSRVAILSENRPEWTLADLGCLSLGAVSVPIYPTCSPEDVLYILRNAGAEVLFLSTREHWQRLQPVLGECPELRHTLLFDPGSQSECGIMSLNELLTAGRDQSLNNETLYVSLLREVKREDIATLIYTSGTTGPPKGVMLTHGNFIANCIGSAEFIQVTPEDLALSFLPLSHVFERLAGYYFMIFCGARIAYAESMQTVQEDLVRFRPTVAASVPRLYEKMYARILDAVEAAPPLRRRIFSWAIDVGGHVSRLRLKGMPVTVLQQLQYLLARVLVFSKLRRRLGGRIRFFISGGAPLSKELAEFFYAAGVMILEGYGLTETSPVIAVNRVEDVRFGTVGRPLRQVEVRIAEDGEILTRGPCVMKGYFRDEKATAEVIREGWFHTGDIGHLDEDGFLCITDRKKDIIVTSGGKNIAPQNIENLLLGDNLFSQVVVIGDRKNYLVALIYLNPDEVQRYALEQGLGERDYGTLISLDSVQRHVSDRLKSRLSELPKYEQIKYFSLLSRELSQAEGELTPTLKVKRKVIHEKYHTAIESLYRKGENYTESGK